MLKNPNETDFPFYVQYNLSGLMLENYGSVYQVILEMRYTIGRELQLAIDAARQYLADMEADVLKSNPENMPNEDSRDIPAIIAVRSYLQKKIIFLKTEIQKGLTRHENPTEFHEHQHKTFLFVQMLVNAVKHGVSGEKAREIFDENMTKYTPPGYDCPEPALEFLTAKLKHIDEMQTFMFAQKR